jgi:hypothetical protein
MFVFICRRQAKILMGKHDDPIYDSVPHHHLGADTLTPIHFRIPTETNRIQTPIRPHASLACVTFQMHHFQHLNNREGEFKAKQSTQVIFYCILQMQVSFTWHFSSPRTEKRQLPRTRVQLRDSLMESAKTRKKSESYLCLERLQFGTQLSDSDLYTGTAQQATNPSGTDQGLEAFKYSNHASFIPTRFSDN